jgi:hypothetical protein
VDHGRARLHQISVNPPDCLNLVGQLGFAQKSNRLKIARGRRAVEFLDAGAKLFILEHDLAPTAVTDELRMIKKPSNSLGVLLPAALTDNRDRCVIKVFFPHGRSCQASSRLVSMAESSPFPEAADQHVH